MGFTQEADIDAVERRFLELVKDNLQKISTSFDEDEVKKEEIWLRDFHAQYFMYMVQWVADESRRNTKPPTPDAAKLRKQARDVMNDLQRHMTEFSCCYMHINRLMTLLRDEMRSEEERLGMSISREIKWTADAGTIMARYKTQKRLLVDNATRMKNARPLLESLENPFSVFRQAIVRLHGADNADATQRPVIAALRMKEFKRARTALAVIAESSKKADIQQQILEAGKTIIDTCEQYQDLFVSEEGRLYLKPSEADQAYNVHMRELGKIKVFLGKYYMPYMQYKLEILMHLKDKLLVIGSIESQMTLYKRLMAGMARPLADIRDLRLYESEVLDKIKYLLGGQFQEVPVILARAHETVGEFRQGADEFRDMEKIDVTEVGTGDNSQIAASGT